jgi:acyl-CoA synthetase (AMP-forming)/AMP-acid ligase II
MDFWTLEHPPERLAVMEPATGRRKTYGELRQEVSQAFMPEQQSLILLLAQNRYECLLAYLAALQSANPLLLVDASLNRELLQQLVDTYRPAYIYASAPDSNLPGYETRADGPLYVRERQSKETVTIHESLALLLNTSGSTGSPKLVRLSRENLQANAASIASYLTLSSDERPITSLPMSYSYGLSVINSHMFAGAALTLTDHTVLRREFWDAIDHCGCTSFAGVPYTYQMLLQTGLLTKRGSTLRKLTQAGGALGEAHVRQMHQLALDRDFKFFVMYGQTEATARISYVPFEQLGEKTGSIGVAIPDGSLHVDADTGELVYRGPNVMLGYAECLEDLAKGDELGGTLRTGDLARKDQDGFFYITGRLKRFLKLFGKRFNLDEVEQIVQHRFGFPVACFGRDDLLMAAIESDETDVSQVAAMLRETFSLPKDAIQVQAVEKLPRTARGKMDYQSLLAMRAITRPAVVASQAVR